MIQHDGKFDILRLGLLAFIFWALSPTKSIPATLRSEAEAQLKRVSVGGLEELPPDQGPGENLIHNSSFEGGSDAWRLGPCWIVDNKDAHDGNQSLRFSANGCRMSPAETLIPGTRKVARSFTLRAWVKTSEGSDLRVRVAIHDQDDRSGIVGATEFVAPGTNWTLLEKKNVDLLPVHDHHVLQVWTVVQGTVGSAWFDQVEVIEQNPLPVSVFLLYPNFRGFLWSDGPGLIREHVDVNLPDVSKVKLHALLQSEDGSTVKTVDQAAQDSQVLQMDVSAVPEGSYRLETQLVDSDSNKVVATYPPYHISKVSADFRKKLVNYIAPDNFLVHDGKKRFLWGVYDRFSAHYRCRECLFRHSADYEELPGFNGLHTIENYSDTLSNAEINILPFASVKTAPAEDELSPWMDALNRHNVGHLQIVNNWVEGNRARPPWAREMSDQQLWHSVTTAMKDKPGAIGYYTYDEPRPDKIPTVFAQARVLRDEDPGSITYGVLANVSQVFRWRDVSDVIGCDPYPIGNIPSTDDIAFGATSAPAMLRTSFSTRETVRQVYGARPVWVVPQLFRINGKFPTYYEMKMQVYKAIINGATGILWWGFVSEKGIEAEWYRYDNHQAYVDFKRISQEVMALEPQLISLSRPDLVASVSNPAIEWLAKSDSDKIVILTSNFSEAGLENVTLKLASSARVDSKRVEVYTEDRALSVNQGRKGEPNSFTDSFKPYEVHVYILKKAN